MEKRLPHKIKTIVIVEDHPGVGAFLADLLKTATPYHVLLVLDELQALEVTKTILPDLFLLDDHLPHMSGLELADRLQEREELKHVPTLLMGLEAPHAKLGNAIWLSSTNRSLPEHCSRC